MKSPLRVLVIQQSEADARLIQRALHQNGREFTVEHVATQDALQSKLAEETWDVVIEGKNAGKDERRTATRHIERSLFTTLDLATVLSRLAQKTRELMDAVACNVYLPEADESSLRMISSRAGQPHTDELAGLPLKEGIVRDVVRSGKSILIQDAIEARTCAPQGAVEEPGTVLCTPLIAGNQVIGLIILTRDADAAPFTPADLDLLAGFAPQAAVAITNAQLHSAGQKRIAELTDTLARQKEQDHVKDQFIQNVSHDLRTPIAIARGYAELLDNGSLGSLHPDQQEPVAIIARRLRMLSSLVSDINALFEVESHLQTFTQVDLTELARHAASDFQTLAQKAGVVLTSEITSESLFVSGDRMQLRRVLDNLLNNALKFTPDGHTIALHLRREHAHAIMEVIDTGIGIPEDKLMRIFERFFQVGTTLSRRQGGSGLGLSLVRQIVESHNGTITVESRLGEGSTFRVSLPILKGGADG